MRSRMRVRPEDELEPQERGGHDRPRVRLSLRPGPDTTPWAFAVKFLHSVVTVVFSSAGVYVLVCGLTGRRDGWLTASAVVLALELVLYVGNGLRCPLTSLAKALGDPTGHDWLFEGIMPERWLRFVAPTFGSLALVGAALILVASQVR